MDPLSQEFSSSFSAVTPGSIGSAASVASPPAPTFSSTGGMTSLTSLTSPNVGSMFSPRVTLPPTRLRDPLAWDFGTLSSSPAGFAAPTSEQLSNQLLQQNVRLARLRGDQAGLELGQAKKMADRKFYETPAFWEGLLGASALFYQIYSDRRNRKEQIRMFDQQMELRQEETQAAREHAINMAHLQADLASARGGSGVNRGGFTNYSGG